MMNSALSFKPLTHLFRCLLGLLCCFHSKNVFGGVRYTDTLSHENGFSRKMEEEHWCCQCYVSEWLEHKESKQ